MARCKLRYAANIIKDKISRALVIKWSPGWEMCKVNDNQINKKEMVLIWKPFKQPTKKVKDRWQKIKV